MSKLDTLIGVFKELKKALDDENMNDGQIVFKMRTILGGRTKIDDASDVADKLIKSLKTLNKDDGEPNQLSNRRPVNGYSGWSQDTGTGAFHHKIHGVISPVRGEDGQYTVRAGNMGSLGSFPDAASAGAKIKEHIDWLGSLKNPEGIYKPANQTSMKSEGDELDAKIAAAIDKEMGKRNMTGKHIADHYRDIDEDIPAKQRSNMKTALVRQNKPKLPKPEMPASLKVAKSSQENIDQEMVQKLATIMPQPKMNLQPTNAEFENAMIESGMAVTPQALEQMNKGWGNVMNNWLTEASKPISSRFNSEEEEQTYWDSIKVSGAARDDGKSGY